MFYKQQEMASSCTRGSLIWGLIKISSPTGVSSPEGISKPGLGTGFSGGLGSAGGMVGFLKVFSNLGDSVSPSPAACASSPSPEGDFKQQREREGSQGCQRSFPTTEHSKPNRDLFLAQRTAEQHPKHSKPSKPNPDLFPALGTAKQTLPWPLSLPQLLPCHRDNGDTK